MRRICAFFLAVMAALTLCGCGNTAESYTPTGNALVDESYPLATTVSSEPEGKQEMTMIYYKNISMNPFRCTDYTNRALFSLLYQGLFAVDADYHAEPILCSRYTCSEDYLTYTFYIDERATFSDGSPVTPEDVAASLNAAQKSDVYRGRFYFMDEVEVAEDGAVKVYLYHSYEELPLLLNVPILKASQIDNDHPMGTGPYSLVSTLTGGRLIRRTDWWCNADLPVDLPYITLKEAESPTQIRDEFQFRDLNFVCADPGSGLYADYLCDYELWECENGYFLYLVCKDDSKVFSSKSLKAALTYAIDRDDIVDTCYRGHARSAQLPASPASPYYNKALSSRYGYDPEKFAEAVANAGMQGAEVTMLVNSDDSVRLQAAKEIVKMLEAGGLKVELLARGGNRYMETMLYEEFDLYLGMTQLSVNMDLSQFFAPWGSLSYAGLENDDLFSLCLNALNNSGNYYNLHKAVMENGAICPILFRSYTIYTTRGVVRDLKPARDAIFYYSIGKNMEDAFYD